jgi:hypothetical protein
MAHIIITGPGRSGTTFLVRILARLGYETGFKPDEEVYYDNLRAGYEYITEDFSFDEPTPEQFEQLPHVLKGPEWSYHLKPFIKAGYLEVEHIILPIRDLDIAVQSRLDVGLFWRVDLDHLVESQTEVMAAALGRVVEACVLFELPCTVLRFPELITNEEYCFYKLTDVFDISRIEFRKAFRELSNPKQIKWHA